MYSLLHLTLNTVLNRSQRTVLQYCSLLKRLQDTTINRNNNTVFDEKINYLPRRGHPKPKRLKAALLIEIYFYLFLEELLESTNRAFSEGFSRMNRVLTVGLIAENFDKEMAIVSKKPLSDELRSWFLSCFNITEDHINPLIIIKSIKN